MIFSKACWKESCPNVSSAHPRSGDLPRERHSRSRRSCDDKLLAVPVPMLRSTPIFFSSLRPDSESHSSRVSAARWCSRARPMRTVHYRRGEPSIHQPPRLYRSAGASHLPPRCERAGARHRASRSTRSQTRRVHPRVAPLSLSGFPHTLESPTPGHCTLQQRVSYQPLVILLMLLLLEVGGRDGAGFPFRKIVTFA